MFHLDERQLVLLGEPTRDQMLDLVAWLALSNAFGRVCDDVDHRDMRGLPPQASRWINQLMSKTGRVRRKVPHDRLVLGNWKRKVRVRKSRGELATGAHR